MRNNQYNGSWNEEEIIFLKNNYLLMSNIQISKFLIGRTPSSISSTLNRLGIKRPKEVYYKFVNEARLLAKILLKEKLGYFNSKETREKQSETRKKLFSEGKIIHPMLGKKNPLLTKMNLENNPTKNKEVVKKIVNSNILNGTYNRSSIRMKENNPTKNGMSKEWREKIRNSSKKKYWDNNEYRNNIRESLKKYTTSIKGKSIEEIYGIDKAKEIKLRRSKQVLPLKDTSIEVKIQNFLKELKIEFFTHQYMHIEHGYQCDIIIPYMKIVIECDGDYWHGNLDIFSEEKLNERILKQRELDKVRTKELLEKGFKVFRIWESEIKIMKLEDFKERIIL